MHDAPGKGPRRGAGLLRAGDGLRGRVSKLASATVPLAVIRVHVYRVAGVNLMVAGTAFGCTLAFHTSLPEASWTRTITPSADMSPFHRSTGRSVATRASTGYSSTVARNRRSEPAHAHACGCGLRHPRDHAAIGQRRDRTLDRRGALFHLQFRRSDQVLSGPGDGELRPRGDEGDRRCRAAAQQQAGAGRELGEEIQLAVASIGGVAADVGDEGDVGRLGAEAEAGSRQASARRITSPSRRARAGRSAPATGAPTTRGPPA
jgi:hypothetical protein